MSSTTFLLSIVVPLYNEKEVFHQLIKRLEQLLNTTDIPIEVVLIDDGSKDDTPLLMRALSLSDARFQSIFLSRNFGHQIAVSAGLLFAKAQDAVLIIDGDLQDPPELLLNFYEYIKQGYDVVYAIRKKRKENWLKRFTYALFYKILSSIAYINIPLDSGDFSLVSRRVVDIINQMPEESRFLRGMRSWVGFNQIGVEYDRSSRAEGESKYTFGKLLSLALNGIFNFSEIPIKFITNLGLITVLASIIYFLITILKKIVYNTVPEGFTALLLAIILFSGVQLISLGVIGEYVLRIYFQVKQRPLFIVKEKIENKTVIK